MAESTGISWCDSTFNPWMGCTKVSPACDKQWGEHAPNWLNDDAGQKIAGSEWIDRMGTKAAGRLLDGVEHNGFPA